MTPLLILEAFGELPATELIESERQRERREAEQPPSGVVEVGVLHRAFESRAELMGWSATSRRAPLPPPLWNMFEAGLTGDPDDASLIGWVYVGLANPTGLSQALPETIAPGTGAGWAGVRMPPGYHESTVGLPVALLPLVQCLNDALRRIGPATVTGYQMTCYGTNLQPSGRYRGHLVEGASWFGVPSQEAPAVALITFDEGAIGGGVSGLLRALRYRNDLDFNFGLAQDLPRQHRVRTPDSPPKPEISFHPADLGISAGLPEWTASAVGWALAAVVDAARDLTPHVENFAIRIARLR